jgi:hypothetical protein
MVGMLEEIFSKYFLVKILKVKDLQEKVKKWKMLK